MKIFLLFVLLMIFALTVFAQEDDGNFLKGRETELYKNVKSGADVCLVFKNYVVKTAIDKNGGEAVRVYQRNVAKTPKNSCQSTETPIISLTGNYSGKADNSEDIISAFYGISGKYLFIHKDVEPFQGAFEIFDLSNGKSLFQAEFYPELKLLQSRFVYFENWSEKDGLVKNCKEAVKWKKQKLGIGWVVKKQLDLQTLEVTNLGLRCEATQ